MTLDELYRAYQMARKRFEVAAFAFNPMGYDPLKEMEAVSNIRAASSFTRQVWEIGRDFGMPAAMLFKLTDGNIDPR